MALLPSKYTRTAKSVGIALLTTVFMAANANAADQAKFVQVAQLDLNKPIPSAMCVKDDAQGTALAKMKTIMGARGQKSVVAANQHVANTDPAHGGLQERIFSSTLQQGGEGYEIISNRPVGKAGTEYCFVQNKQVFIYSVFNSKGVPALANKGELGTALTNNEKAGLKVAVIALTEQGALSVVNFDPETGRGSQKMSNVAGNKAGDAAVLENAGYSASLPLAAKKALGIPMDDTIASAGTGTGAGPLYASAKPAP